MSEEVDNVEAAVEATTETPTEVVETSTENGKFYDTWSEDLKNNPSLSKFENEEEIYKSYLEVQKMVGYKGDIPKPDAEPDEWNAFYSKLGRPDETSGYELKHEEGGIGSQEYLDKVSEVAHANNLTKSQAEGLVTGMMEYEQGVATANKEVEDAARESGEKMLSDEWGESLNDMSAAIQNMERHYGLDEKTMEEIESNPHALLLLGKIAKDLEEKSQVGNSFDATRQGLTDQLAEIDSQIQGIVKETGDVKDRRLDNLLSRRERIMEKVID